MLIKASFSGFTPSLGAQARYREILKEYSSIYRDSLQNHDFTKIIETAHKMKGNAKLYGFERLSELGDVLMKEAENQNWNELENSILEVQLQIKNIVISAELQP